MLLVLMLVLLFPQLSLSSLLPLRGLREQMCGVGAVVFVALGAVVGVAAAVLP